MGDFSNSLGAKRAILNFQKTMEENIGFCPFIILMEVTGRSYTDARKFEGVDNFLWINSNPAQIEQVLVNFKEMLNFLELMLGQFCNILIVIQKWVI